jgi:hypothetical protein
VSIPGFYRVGLQSLDWKETGRSCEGSDAGSRSAGAGENFYCDMGRDEPSPTCFIRSTKMKFEMSSLGSSYIEVDLAQYSEGSEQRF